MHMLLSSEVRDMALLTQREKADIIRRRGDRCESKAKTPCKGKLEVHHVDRDPHNNDAANLKVYCEAHHPAPGTKP